MAVPQMLLETELMRDEVLDLRVRLAINNNRLVRLDNPIVADRIGQLQQEAGRALQAFNVAALD